MRIKLIVSIVKAWGSLCLWMAVAAAKEYILRGLAETRHLKRDDVPIPA
jgi:hypothetical protein